MQLRKIRIRNFRNFADVTIDPFPTPTVIVGENGVGRSNLLHALRLVLDPDLPDRRRRLQPDDVHDGSPSLADGVEVSVEVELTDFDTDLDAPQRSVRGDDRPGSRKRPGPVRAGVKLVTLGSDLGLVTGGTRQSAQPYRRWSTPPTGRTTRWPAVGGAGSAA